MVEIIARMEKTLHELAGQPAAKGCIPFLHTYWLTTKNIFEHGQQAGFYADPQSLERLDVFFADQYFTPLEHFRSGQTSISSPWNTFYTYAGAEHSRAFVALLLGVNAHINGDLPMALATTHYQQASDFEKIDPLLSEVVSPSMQFLAKEFHDVQAIGATVMPGFTQREFSRLVLGWRHQAWDNAQQITPQNFELKKASINQQTEVVAEQIIQFFQRPVNSMFTRRVWRNLEVKI